MTISGSCLCGAVSFTVEKLTGPFEICHCDRCRKTSSGLGAAMIGCQTNDFSFVNGADKIQSFTAPLLHTPPAYHSDFCGTCGSSLPHVDMQSDVMGIPAGLIDGNIDIKPGRHIYIEYLPTWDKITDKLPQHTAREL